MIVVDEFYLVKCLDTSVYQSKLSVKIGDEEFHYTHQTRLWSEAYIDSLRDREKSVARNHVMNQIRNKLFGGYV